MMSRRPLRGCRARRLVVLGRSGYAFVRGRLAPSAADHGRVLGQTQTYATPLVRRVAQQHQVDLADVRGTGVGGRIRPVDVKAAAVERTALFPRAAALVSLAVEAPFDEAALMLGLLSVEERDKLLIATLELQAATFVALSHRSDDPDRLRRVYRDHIAQTALDLEMTRG